MEMDEHRLKDIYQAGVRSITPASREDCPSSEMMLKLLRSRLSGKKATKVIDHVSRCGYCAGEFEFLLETIRQEKQFIDQVGQSPASGRRKGRKASAPQGIGALSGRWLVAFRRLSLSSVSLLVGLVVTGLAVAAFVIFRSPETYRSGYNSRVRLIQPIADGVSQSPLVFKWEAVKETESYTLELFDEALRPVWKADGIRANEFTLPEEAAGKFASRGVFFWMITAHLPEGEERPSRLEKFVLGK